MVGVACGNEWLKSVSIVDEGVVGALPDSFVGDWVEEVVGVSPLAQVGVESGCVWGWVVPHGGWI